MTPVALQRRFPEDVYLLQESVWQVQDLWAKFPTSVTESRSSVVSDAIIRRFEQLADRWRKDTRFVSSIHEMVLHPAYQRIISMGQEALPLIFTELRHRPDHWFWALQAITGEDPVPMEDRGNITAMTRHWIQWAEERNI